MAADGFFTRLQQVRAPTGRGREGERNAIHFAVVASPATDLQVRGSRFAHTAGSGTRQKEQQVSIHRHCWSDSNDCFYRSRRVRRTYIVRNDSEDDVIGRPSPLLLPKVDSVESTNSARSMIYDGGTFFNSSIFSFYFLCYCSPHSFPSLPLTLSPVDCFLVFAVKKHSSDLFSKRRFVWIDPTTKSLHW
jgi:hypothetical protein